MQQYGLYVTVLGFAGGVILCSFFNFSFPFVLFCVLLTVVSYFYSWQMAPAERLPLQLVTLALVLIAVGMWRMDRAQQFGWSESLTAEIGETQTITGTVVREPDLRTNTQHLYLRVANEPALLLVITDRYQPVAYGDRLSITGELALPEPFVTDTGRIFPYPEYLATKRVRYTMVYPEELMVVEQGKGNPVVATLLTVKDQFQSGLRGVMRPPMVYLAEGVLLGEKRALGDEWEELFRKTGIIHIVVLSGFNVMLVVAFMLTLLSLGFGVRGRAVGGVIGIILFALLVGLSATVVRASIMAALTVLAVAYGRQYHIARALVLTGGIMVFVNPYVLLYDPGFQLSFMATLGLVVLAPEFEKRLTLAPATLRIRSYIVATVATQIAVLPLLLYSIGEVSLVAVLANVLILPMVPLAMILTFATGVVALVWAQGALVLALLTEWSLQYILFVVALLGNAPLAAVSVPTFPAWAMVGLYVLYAIVMVYIFRRAKHTTVPQLGITNDTETINVDEWTIDELVDSKTGATQRVAPVHRSIFNP